MSMLVQISFWLAAFFAVVSAQGTFIQPPPPGPTGDFSNDASYKLGLNITIEWESDLQNMDLLVFQQYPSSATAWPVATIEPNTTEQSANWTVSLDGLVSDIPNGEDAVLFFVVVETGSSVWDSDSHYINVTIPATTTTTSTASSTASRTSTPSLPAASQTQKSTSKPTPATTSAPPAVSHGLSKGATAGIAIVATIGGILVIAGLAFIAWRRHLQNNRDESDPRAELPGGAIDKTDTGLLEGFREAPEQNAIHEMPTGQKQDPIQELPAESREESQGVDVDTEEASKVLPTEFRDRLEGGE